jgi:hypothetical protein
MRLRLLFALLVPAAAAAAAAAAARAPFAPPLLLPAHPHRPPLADGRASALLADILQQRMGGL